MRGVRPVLLAAFAIASPAGIAGAQSPPPAAAPAPPAPPPAPSPAYSAAPGAPPAPIAPGVVTDPDGRRGELIEITSTAPIPPGTVAIDAQAARTTAGALGEPLRALALLPGVTTSIAASGYPVIRGALPGESRYRFDGIEIPMLYHLLLGNQVIHPSFVGDLELRAGGQGAEHGHLVGGLVEMTPARIEIERTEFRANPVEVGGYRVSRLGGSTAIAYALRVGTLSLPAKLFDSSMSLYYVDQQTRLVHRLDSGDRLTLTSLGAFDHATLPHEQLGEVVTDQLGFHRLDARWTRGVAGRQLRAGVETSLDMLRQVTEYPPRMAFPGDPFPVIPGQDPPLREGGRSYGIRVYGDGELEVAPWLTARAGAAARHRTLDNGRSPFRLTDTGDPFLGLARDVDAAGAWTTLGLRLGPLTLTPGIRADTYHVELYGAAVQHTSVDPRLEIAAALPGGARIELAAGRYTAPPQVSLFGASNIAIGPLPMTDGAAASAGMNRASQAQVALRAPLTAGLQAELAAYYRRTHYAVDFGLLDGTFQVFGNGDPCGVQGGGTPVYRDLDQRALGLEAMVRGELGNSVTGWVSYSLARIDRDYGFVTLPTAFDQRHTANATLQWRVDAWTLGATGHLHTGRPLQYPRLARCDGGYVDGMKTIDHLHRAPTNYRLDLRAERAFRAAGYDMRLYVELQNASFTTDVIDYTYRVDGPAPSDARIIPMTAFLPVPLIGVEVSR